MASQRRSIGSLALAFGSCLACLYVAGRYAAAPRSLWYINSTEAYIQVQHSLHNLPPNRYSWLYDGALLTSLAFLWQRKDSKLLTTISHWPAGYGAQVGSCTTWYVAVSAIWPAESPSRLLSLCQQGTVCIIVSTHSTLQKWIF